MGRALRHRNYRLFFVGQAISLTGTWLTQLATAWLVYRLTGSALLLGVASFAGQAPMLFLGPFAGVWIDRLDRRRVLIATQSCAMLQSALLAAFALSGTIGVIHIVLLNLFQGLINVLDMPARQTMVIDMLEDRADLPNAVALNSSMVNAARLVGPSIGGLLIAAFGEGMCFLLDALSYAAVIGSLLAMRVAQRPSKHTARVLHQLHDGLRYAAGFPPIRAVLGLLAVTSLLGLPYMTMMPVIVRSVFHGEASLLGFMMAGSGLGALVGALYLASRASVLGLGRVIALGSGMFGVALVGLSLSRHVALSLVLMAVAGASMMVQVAASNTVLQTIVDEERRGRVMSLYSVAIFGMMPFGNLLAGMLAERIGASETLGVGGVMCAIGGLGFLRILPALRSHVRPIYERLGILPELAQGVSAASAPSSDPPR